MTTSVEERKGTDYRRIATDFWNGSFCFSKGIINAYILGFVLCRLLGYIISPLVTTIRYDPKQKKSKKKRPDTRHKMRLVYILFTFENNTGRTYGPADGRTDGHDLL